MSDYSLPISQVIDSTTSASEGGTIREKLHGWVVTVDHKRLGILYILYSTFFSLVAHRARRGGRGFYHPPLTRQSSRSCFERTSLQPILHDARHDDGVLSR